MKILSLDTTAQVCSAAICDENELIAEITVNTGNTHSETLLPAIEQILKISELCVDDIDAFACSTGPGSFTGIRIGISAVKGLAAAENKPCYAVSSLWAMAELVSHSSAVICSVMDARCGQVYNALFKSSGGRLLRLTEDRAISTEELKTELMSYSKVILVGDGTDLVLNYLKLPSVTPAPEHLKYQNAIGVAFAAKEISPCAPAELEAFYLRLPQAERELKKKESSK